MIDPRLKIPIMDMRPIHMAFGDRFWKRAITRSFGSFEYWWAARMYSDDPHWRCHHERNVCYLRPDVIDCSHDDPGDKRPAWVSP
jgi:hypothetical protein